MNDNKNRLILFFIGLLSQFFFRLVGIWSFSELLVILVFVNIFFTSGFDLGDSPKVRRLVLYFVLACISIVLSDVINESTPLNAMKGLGSFIFLFPSFIVFHSLLKRDISLIKYFVLGLTLSKIIINFFPQYTAVHFALEGFNLIESPEEESGISRYIVAYLEPIIIFISAWLYSKYPRIVSILLVAAAVSFLYGNSRYRFLVYGLSGFILLYVGSINKENVLGAISRYKSRTVVLFGILCIAGWSISAFYEYAATEGYFGEQIKEKFERQSNSKLGLASGRSELFLSYEAVKRAPFFGHGSYAQDRDFIDDFFDSLDDSSIHRPIASFVAGHNFILAFWAFNGILMLPFWLFVIKELVVCVMRNILNDYRITAYLLVVIFTLLWDIFGSPFGNRVGNACTIVLVLLINNHLFNNNESLNDN